MNTSTSSIKLPSVQPTMVQAFQDLLDSGKNSDVTFKVQNEEIQAHKLILCTRSPRFDEILNSLSPTESPLPINDCTPVDFKCFLTFLYTDDCCLSTLNVEQIFKLAKDWDVHGLIFKCMVFMEKQIDESNILRYAKIGFTYGGVKCDLFKACLSMLPDLLPDINFMICEDSKWIPLSYDLLFNIVKYVKRDEQLEETLVYKIIDWSKKLWHHVGYLDPTPANSKIVLGEIPKCIKYDKLTTLTLATVVHEYQLLPPEELLDIFCERAIEEQKVRAKNAATTL